MSTTHPFKINSPVKDTRNGKEGRYAGLDDRGPGKGKGLWLKVNFAPKGKPAEIKTIRPAYVAAA